MEKIFVDSEGRKRKGVLVQCSFCDKEFLTRKDQPGKFCSRKCSCLNKSKTKSQKVECAACGKEFKKALCKLKNSKSGLYFCSRKCKDSSQKIGGIEAIMPHHYGTSKTRQPSFYRKLYKEDKQLMCQRCGYCEFECGIDIHHKDDNCTNNKKENLIALCSPCHRGLHLGLWGLKDLH